VNTASSRSTFGFLDSLLVSPTHELEALLADLASSPVHQHTFAAVAAFIQEGSS
jgi:hypothetical protein